MSASEHETALSDLPDGVLCAVFRHLHRRDCAAVRLTCRHWRDVLDGCLDSLKPKQLDGAFAPKIIGRFKQLQNLVVTRPNGYNYKPVIADLSCLSACRCLQTVILDEADVHNLQALSGCQSVRSLSLCSCPKIKDISPLAACKNLTELDLSHTGVANAGPLAACERLKVLSLRGCNQLTSLGGLVCSGCLETLDISSSSKLGLQGLGDISAWSNLQWLDLSHTPTTSLQALTACTSLYHLELENFTDTLELFGGRLAAGQEFCSGLTYLSLAYSSVEGVLDLVPVMFPRLVFLELSGTYVQDISPLSQCTLLQMLRMMGTEVHVNLAPLTACKQLTTLDISYSRVSDVTSLACTRLENVNLAQSEVTDISALAACTNLRFLVYPDENEGQPPLGAAAVAIACPLLQVVAWDAFCEECFAFIGRPRVTWPALI